MASNMNKSVPFPAEPIKLVSTVPIPGSSAAKILSGNTLLLQILNSMLRNSGAVISSPNGHFESFETLRTVVYSPGLARLLGHACASAPDLSTGAILDKLPLWPQTLPRPSDSAGPVSGEDASGGYDAQAERELLKKYLPEGATGYVMEGTNMTASDHMAMWYAQELAKSVIAEYERISDPSDPNTDGGPDSASERDTRRMSQVQSTCQAFQKLWQTLVAENATFVFLTAEGQTFLGVRHAERRTLHVTPLDILGMDKDTFAENLSRLATAESWRILETGAWKLSAREETAIAKDESADVPIAALD